MEILPVIYEMYNLVKASYMYCDLHSHQNIDLSQESLLRGKPLFKVHLDLEEIRGIAVLRTSKKGRETKVLLLKQ